MYSQILAYIDTFLSPYLFRYRQGYSTEQCLTVVLEKWEKSSGRKGRKLFHKNVFANQIFSCRRGVVVKGVEHFSTIVLVNI